MSPSETHRELIISLLIPNNKCPFCNIELNHSVYINSLSHQYCKRDFWFYDIKNIFSFSLDKSQFADIFVRIFVDKKTAVIYNNKVLNNKVLSMIDLQIEDYSDIFAIENKIKKLMAFI